MLLREVTKKLENVSVITLKKYGKKYEVAVYPNTLYEYRHNPSANLLEILHSDQIYRNIATGETASEQELSLFGLSKTEIIHEILKHGHEQKPKETSQYEAESVERQIVDMVQGKVMYNGTYLSGEILLKFIRSVWNIKNSDAKKQVSGIIRKLEEVGFERVSYRVKCNPEAICFEGAEKTEDGVVVKSDILPDFIDYCDSHKIKYIITKNEEVEEEEIC